MTRLTEIASELSKLYPALRQIETLQSHNRQDLDGRKLCLTPADGWPGKNEEQRKTAAEKTFADDETCKALVTAIRENDLQISRLSAQAQSLEAERRALEWELRAALVESLRTAHIYPNSNGNGHEPVEETAFDDAAIAESDQRIEAMLGAAEDDLFAGGPYPDGLPFCHDDDAAHAADIPELDF